jgi:hypothetical protein
VKRRFPRLFFASIGLKASGKTRLNNDFTPVGVDLHNSKSVRRSGDAHLSSEIHGRAHEIALAKLDPAMAQDVICCCAVKIEVRQNEILQKPIPCKLALVGAELERDVLVLGTVDLRRLEGFALFDRFGEARLEFGKAGFRVGHVRHLGAGKGATTPSGVSARLLHLARIRIHVGREPHIEKKVRIELLRLNMRYRLINTSRLGS